MQKELASFIDELSHYQMPRWKETERSIDGCFQIPYSGFLSADYVKIEDYVENSVNLLLLQAIDHFQPESFFELQKMIEQLDEEDWVFQQVERDLIWQDGSRESLIILDHYEEYLEDDTGIWGKEKDSREILRIQAYFTYRNALYHRLRQKVEKAMEDVQTEALSAYKHVW